MKTKAPTVEELKEFRKTLKSFGTDWNKKQEFKKHYPRSVSEVNILDGLMTLPMIQASEPRNRDLVWKYLKRCSKFWFCPGLPEEYRRMEDYANDEAIIKTLILALDEVGYPFRINDFIPDVITYYYSIALLSQARVLRDECLKTLDRIIEQAVTVAQNNCLSNAFEPMVRNMALLSEQFPDLIDLKNKTESIPEACYKGRYQ